MLVAYGTAINQALANARTKLEDLKVLRDHAVSVLAAQGDLKPWEFRGLKALWFSRHLYEPLLYLDQNIVEISPVPVAWPGTVVVVVPLPAT